MHLLTLLFLLIPSYLALNIQKSILNIQKTILSLPILETIPLLKAPRLDRTLRLGIHRETRSIPLDASEERRVDGAVGNQLIMDTINEANVDYSVTAWIGTPSKPFRLLVDTGSADTWVPGAITSSHARYTLENTSTAVPLPFSSLGTTQHIRYGSGEVEGYDMTDLVSFASIGSFNTSIRYPFLVAMNTTDFFNHVSYDGLLGLAFPGASVLTPASPPLIKTLVKAKIIDHAIFSVKYGYLDSPGQVEEQGGELILGGWDPRIGPIRWIPVAKDPLSSHWDLELLEFRITESANKNASTLYPRSGENGGHIRVILDTGTSLMVLPIQDAIRINRALGATIISGETEFWRLPCSQDSLPDLEINLGGQMFTLYPKDYVFNWGNEQCISTFAGSAGLSPGRWIFGDVWFRAYSTVFDMDRYLLGFGSRTSPTGQERVQ
ncbi:MAG: aspartic peptidase domain-containing protein [Piptocephalis tieghemiana]|nr:MAG: aspartic peptidase domain-containing protein [Piptocephalis tieghemiana]